MYLKDYERSRLLERGVMAELSDSEEEQGEKGNVTVERMTYDQEQKDIRERSATVELPWIKKMLLRSNCDDTCTCMLRNFAMEKDVAYLRTI